jgi:hypothetical protein
MSTESTWNEIFINIGGFYKVVKCYINSTLTQMTSVQVHVNSVDVESHSALTQCLEDELIQQEYIGISSTF